MSFLFKLGIKIKIYSFLQISSFILDARALDKKRIQQSDKTQTGSLK